jgi:hypothetical protein
MSNVNHQRQLAYQSGRQSLKVRLAKLLTLPILVNLDKGHRNMRLSTSTIPITNNMLTAITTF